MTAIPKTDMPTVKKRRTPGGAWAEIRSLAWARRYHLAFGLVLVVINRLTSLVLPATSKFLIDNVLLGKQWDLLPALVIVAIVASLTDAATAFANAQILGVAGFRAVAEVRRRVQAHVFRLPIRHFDATRSGELISRVMTDAEGLRNLMGMGLVQLTGSTFLAITVMCILFFLNWRLTALTLLEVGLFGGAVVLLQKYQRPLFRMRSRINAEVTGRLGEGLGGIRIVKVYTAERREDLVFTKGVHRLLRNQVQSLTRASGLFAFGSILTGAVGVSMMLVGTASIRAGTMTIGDFIMYLTLMALITVPVMQIASVGTMITEALAGLDRIHDLRRLETEADEDRSREPLPDIRGDVEFRDVSFEYEANVPVLRHVSFSAPALTTTALVGSSGSGKSTLINLVMAFSQPQSGRVLVDGYDLARVRQLEFRRHLGVVLQDNFLFDGTIAENIAYGKPHATIEDIQNASRIAHCAEFVEAFEQGYGTRVGERGVRLSGGQRQRVAIARAILADPKILILDEATSSLDSESEALIQDGLRSLRRGRTTFVIAHRLSTIQSADQILVVESGEIVERGRHDELLAANGRYRQLYEQQYRFDRSAVATPDAELTAAVESRRWAAR
jgi:subfamily B ATP-binding cassette protein MsbA